MKITYNNSLFLILIVAICIGEGSCKKNKNTTSEGPDRPYQPWAFRSVLDSQSRILTLALHDDLWAAYHTDSCSLYKVWKGHVHLQGAVYDNAHGPQPISIGNAWMENPYKQPWKVTRDGQDILQSVGYKGHALKDGHVSLMYQLTCKDGSSFIIHEQPEAIQNADGQIGFERIFSTKGIPKEYEITLTQRINSIALNRNIETDGKWNVTQELKSDFNGKQILTVDGDVILKPDGETFFRTYFISSPTIDNLNKLSTDEAAQSLGERLIAKNDCKTCHNAKVQTIGPAYIHIAEKYAYNNEMVAQLSNKIIKGGGGIWGTQMMSPHPELAMSDANEMVRYILSLDTTDSGQEATGGVAHTLATE